MTLLKPALLVTVIVAAVMSSGSVATADGPYEPNESVTQAKGPIVGGIPFHGVIETANDVDWFFLYTAGQRQFEVVLTWRGGGCRVYASLRDRDAQAEEGSTSAYLYDPIGRITLTSPGSARYNLEVSTSGSAGGCEGTAYTLQVNPADALTWRPPMYCFNHVHSQAHKHRKRHLHKRRHRHGSGRIHIHGRRHRHASGRIHIHRPIHIHRRTHIHRQNHPHCVLAP